MSERAASMPLPPPKIVRPHLMIPRDVGDDGLELYSTLAGSELHYELNAHEALIWAEKLVAFARRKLKPQLPPARGREVAGS